MPANQTYTDAVVVTPSDSLYLPRGAAAIYVGDTGSISLVTEAARLRAFSSGNPEVVLHFPNVMARSIIPLAIAKIYATGTTVANIVALY